MEGGKREGNTKMWKTIKKVLGCGSYRPGRRRWKEVTHERKSGNLLNLATVLSPSPSPHHRLLIPVFIPILHSSPSFIFLRLSLLFMVELYNSERVSIARGECFKEPRAFSSIFAWLPGAHKREKSINSCLLSGALPCAPRDEIITVLR